MHQQSLFAAEPIPDGFLFKPSVISPTEEIEMLALIRELPFQEFPMQGVAAKRRIVHFGVRYSFASSSIQPAPPLPPAFDLLRRALPPWQN